MLADFLLFKDNVAWIASYTGISETCDHIKPSFCPDRKSSRKSGSLFWLVLYVVTFGGLCRWLVTSVHTCVFMATLGWSFLRPPQLPLGVHMLGFDLTFTAQFKTSFYVTVYLWTLISQSTLLICWRLQMHFMFFESHPKHLVCYSEWSNSYSLNRCHAEEIAAIALDDIADLTHFSQSFPWQGYHLGRLLHMPVMLSTLNWLSRPLCLN